MRADKANSLSKVASVALREPLLTEREIAEKAGVGNGTAHRALKELEQIGAIDPQMVRIAEADKKIVELSQFISNYKFEELKKKIENGEGVEMNDAKKASEIAKESTARYAIFAPKAEGDKDQVINIVF